MRRTSRSHATRSFGKKLSSSFYLRDTVTVARQLIGTILVRRLGRSFLAGRIVEAEAYCRDDPASHSFRGQTPRNEVMFKRGGHLYVYFTYGMHYCANVVTQKEGIGEAVLIRAVEPLAGIDRMKRNRRFRSSDREIRTLTNGPAKLSKAFGIGRKDNGKSLLSGEIFLTRGRRISHSMIAASRRIGVKNGADKLWRFYLPNNNWVSHREKKGRLIR